jgi:hypothetical protein
MKRLITLVAIMSLLLINVMPANAATTYKLTLIVIEESAMGQIALYDDDGDQSPKHGLKKCTSNKIFYVNRNATSTADIAGFTKVGNRTQVKVKNDSGKVVGLGNLTKVKWTKTDEYEDDDPEIGYVVRGTCSYSAVITLKASDFYSIEIPNMTTPYDISLADLKADKWKLTLTI